LRGEQVDYKWNEKIRGKWQRSELTPYSGGKCPAVGEIVEVIQLEGYSLNGKKEQTDFLAIRRGKFEVIAHKAYIVLMKSLRSGYSVSFTKSDIAAGLVQFVIEN